MKQYDKDIRNTDIESDTLKIRDIILIKNKIENLIRNDRNVIHVGYSGMFNNKKINRIDPKDFDIDELAVVDTIIITNPVILSHIFSDYKYYLKKYNKKVTNQIIFTMPSFGKKEDIEIYWDTDFCFMETENGKYKRWFASRINSIAKIFLYNHSREIKLVNIFFELFLKDRNSSVKISYTNTEDNKITKIYGINKIDNIVEFNENIMLYPGKNEIELEYFGKLYYRNDEDEYPLLFSVHDFTVESEAALSCFDAYYKSMNEFILDYIEDTDIISSKLRSSGFYDIVYNFGDEIMTELFLAKKMMVPQYTQKLNVIESYNSLKEIFDYKPIDFKEETTPLVTIIIPVYNNFDYTYNCLTSIINNSGDEVSYEIIIADDCSNDLTVDIQKIISHINVVKTPENLKFLKNCNNAAKKTKGKYILFLNNDTQVQENWLLSLIELIDKDDNIAVVGPKLVFKNGMLQDAGGILWNDASVWNYGRLSDPALPEFNYVREVDYISGTALMIRKSVWEKIGGFDENFAPAFGGDVDICFSVRKNGYKVLYQPNSVVVHFDGISNGKYITLGQIYCQSIIKKKLFDKWKEVLEKESFPVGENVFLAKDRSRNKKTLLMVDHYVPRFDKDAGSRTVFHYLELFVKLGFNVKFIGDNFHKYEPYTSILEQMGIEVLYGIYYAVNWKTWLETNGTYIDYVFLNRPHISLRYINEIKKYTNAKIIYYGHDLHFLRESREYTFTDDKEKLRSSQKWKIFELSVMKKSDVVYYPSTLEIDIIRDMDPFINCKTIPVNIFQRVSLKEYDNKRKDLLFVGGFSHYPNVDGIIWFVDYIMPLIREKIPEIILNIVGSNTTNKINRLATKDIKILGYLDDKTLDVYYKKCRICVAPLRYGAGVKGKITEAMYKQVPVITTAIGAEGLPDIGDCIMIEDDPEKFANKLIKMYYDDELLMNMSKKSFNYVMEFFTIDKAIEILKEDFYISNSQKIDNLILVK